MARPVTDVGTTRNQRSRSPGAHGCSGSRASRARSCSSVTSVATPARARSNPSRPRCRHRRPRRPRRTRPRALPACRRPGAEDDRVTVDGVVHRHDDGLAVEDEADPTHPLRPPGASSTRRRRGRRPDAVSLGRIFAVERGTAVGRRSSFMAVSVCFVLPHHRARAAPEQGRTQPRPGPRTVRRRAVPTKDLRPFRRAGARSGPWSCPSWEEVPRPMSEPSTSDPPRAGAHTQPGTRIPRAPRPRRGLPTSGAPRPVGRVAIGTGGAPIVLRR